MKWLAIQLISAYKRWISPALPVSCRFVPTCSEYAIEALDRYGIVLGTLLALWRIARCNPLGGSGYDPVPVRKRPEADVPMPEHEQVIPPARTSRAGWRQNITSAAVRNAAAGEPEHAHTGAAGGLGRCCSISN